MIMNVHWLTLSKIQTGTFLNKQKTMYIIRLLNLITNLHYKINRNYYKINPLLMAIMKKVNQITMIKVIMIILLIIIKRNLWIYKIHLLKKVKHKVQIKEMKKKYKNK